MGQIKKSDSLGSSVERRPAVTGGPGPGRAKASTRQPAVTRPITHVVVDGGAVVFEGRSLVESMAFVEGRRTGIVCGVLCKVLSSTAQNGVMTVGRNRENKHKTANRITRTADH